MYDNAVDQLPRDVPDADLTLPSSLQRVNDTNDLRPLQSDGVLYSALDIIERFGKHPCKAANRDVSPNKRWLARQERCSQIWPRITSVRIRRRDGGGWFLAQHVETSSTFMFTPCSRFVVVSKQLDAQRGAWYPFRYRRYEVYDLAAPERAEFLAALRKKEWRRFFVDVDGDHVVWSRVMEFCVG